jgi:cell division protein FtsW
MKKHIDYYLLGAVGILLVFGFLFLATLSASASLKDFGNTNFYIFHQLKSFALALILAIIAFFIPINFVKKLSPWILLITLILLLSVMFFGANYWGAQRWLVIFGMVLQPSEILKLASILYLSAWIASRIKDNKGKGILSSAKGGYYNFLNLYLPFAILLTIVSTIMIIQSDLSTLGIIGLTLVTLYFSARTPLWHTFLTVLGAIGGLFIFIRFEPYRWERFSVFLHPETDPLGAGFQIKQSLIAIGSGGIFGKGIGMSSQKFGYIPQAMTDSVFPIIAEESGIVGCIILIALFIFLLWRGIVISKNSTDNFSKFTALGIVFWITLQAFINISSSIGIWPLAGIPLPFFSYGGSHLLTELAGVGLLLNISKNS